jgi:hypothetical protein
MAYQVNRYNGSFLVSVADGTIDSTTSIRFVGKNYAGYGQVQNENFLHLLENFSGSSEPTKPISGQLWFNTTDRKIRVYDGTKFRLVGSATSSATLPTGLASGEFWFDSSSQQLYCWNGSEYTLIGPENPTALGETAVTTQVVKDTTGKNQILSKMHAGGTVIAVISKGDADTGASFTLSSAYPITGFSKIYRGINLLGTDDTGRTPLVSSILWGTASSANALVSGTDLITVADLVKKTEPTFESTVLLHDGLALNVGTSQKATIALENSADIVIQNESDDNIKFKVKISSSINRTVANISSSGIFPGTTGLYTLGSNNLRWSQLYVDNLDVSTSGYINGNIIGNLIASDGDVLVNSTTKAIAGTLTGNVVGNLTGNVTGNLNGTATTAANARALNDALADSAATAGSIALRNASGNLLANQFIGTADKADRIKVDNTAVDDPVSLYKSAKTTKTASTIAARDTAGNLSANVFNGTATAVQNADLAEKYLADKEYDVGTVMIVGGEREVTASVWVGQRAIGVVSGAPGLMMNQDLEGGTYIALKGRVPVKVIGHVHKGDRLVAAPDGYAMAVESSAAETFAIALETSLNTDVKIIEAIVL